MWTLIRLLVLKFSIFKSGLNGKPFSIRYSFVIYFYSGFYSEFISIMGKNRRIFWDQITISDSIIIVFSSSLVFIKLNDSIAFRVYYQKAVLCFHTNIVCEIGCAVLSMMSFHLILSLNKWFCFRIKLNFSLFLVIKIMLSFVSYFR